MLLGSRYLCHKLSHLLGPSPLERDVLYGRPLTSPYFRINTAKFRQFTSFYMLFTLRYSRLNKMD